MRSISTVSQAVMENPKDFPIKVRTPKMGVSYYALLPSRARWVTFQAKNKVRRSFASKELALKPLHAYIIHHLYSSGERKENKGKLR